MKVTVPRYPEALQRVQDLKSNILSTAEKKIRHDADVVSPKRFAKNELWVDEKNMYEFTSIYIYTYGMLYA